MKNFLHDEKENDKRVPEKIDPKTDCPEDTSSSIENISCIQLMRMVKRDKEIFNISAKLSICSD